MQGVWTIEKLWFLLINCVSQNIFTDTLNIYISIFSFSKPSQLFMTYFNVCKFSWSCVGFHNIEGNQYLMCTKSTFKKNVNLQPLIWKIFNMTHDSQYFNIKSSWPLLPNKYKRIWYSHLKPCKLYGNKSFIYLSFFFNLYPFSVHNSEVLLFLSFSTFTNQDLNRA